MYTDCERATVAMRVVQLKAELAYTTYDYQDHIFREKEAREMTGPMLRFATDSWRTWLPYLLR